MEFRIKEVLVPLKSGNITIFYPQTMEKITKTTGHLWWKKTTEEEDWVAFYRDKTTKVIYTSDFHNTVLVNFETIAEAQSFIEEYKEEMKARTKIFWKKQGLKIFTDERYVKIHPTK